MSLFKKSPGLDAPLATGGRGPRGAVDSGGGTRGSSERFGRWTESIARGMGTPWFLLILTLICLAWLAWNSYGPEELRFDSAALGFTALTLILSLQASYAAPMILLAQNRQDDRDRVQMEQDRQRAERNLADTEFLAREVVALRLALQELPDREMLRTELKQLLAELEATREELSDDRETAALRAADAADAVEAAHGGGSGSDAGNGSDPGAVPAPARGAVPGSAPAEEGDAEPKP